MGVYTIYSQQIQTHFTQRPTNHQPPTNNNAQDEEFGHRRIFQHCSGQARPWSCSPRSSSYCPPSTSNSPPRCPLSSPARPPPRRPPQCRPSQCVPPPTCPPARSTCGGQGGPEDPG